MTDIPEDHPRYQSLMTREKLVKGVRDGITSMQGLIAQGRGEAFDYLLGERTTGPALRAAEAAVAMLLLAERPVLSVNGNTAALVPDEMCALSKAVNAPIEANLFHRTEERINKIVSLLKSCGCETVYGDRPDRLIPGLSHDRAKAYSEGIYAADVVLVPLEDGDRCEALLNMGKKVITIDLNPLSRTARSATITIVDNIVRAIPAMTRMASEMKGMRRDDLEKIIQNYNNESILKEVLEEIVSTTKKL